jgi:hypothetical protein
MSQCSVTFDEVAGVRDVIERRLLGSVIRIGDDWVLACPYRSDSARERLAEDLTEAILESLACTTDGALYESLRTAARLP